MFNYRFGYIIIIFSRREIIYITLAKFKRKKYDTIHSKLKLFVTTMNILG